jgi:hypothetical protein
MKPSVLTAYIGLAFVLAAPVPTKAQGVVKGAQEGAAAGDRAAGPVGGAVGGAVGGVAGGVAGGVKGVLGIPQNTSTSGSHRARRTRVMSQSSMKSALIGRPLQWTNGDGTQSGTTVFYTDGSSALTNSNLPTGPDDQGRWSFKGNRLCVTWDKVRPGEEICTSWTQTGPKVYENSDGVRVTTK